MRNRHPNRQRRTAAAVVATLAVALAMAWGTGLAFAEEDEDVPLDTKLMRQFLKDLGLRKDGESIDYRERAPLVVPPSRNLPPPQSEAAVSSNPAWPKDPDARQRKAEPANAQQKKQPNRTAAEAMDAEGRPVSRTELDRGKVAAGTSTSRSQTPEEGSRPLRPDELGHKKSFFSDLFSSFTPEKEESAAFAGEPVRESLTAPPAGYQTPSPNQPYGLGPKKATGKAMTLEQRTAGETR
jgi:hypothetical protein